MANYVAFSLAFLKDYTFENNISISLNTLSFLTKLESIYKWSFISDYMWTAIGGLWRFWSSYLFHPIKGLKVFRKYQRERRLLYPSPYKALLRLPDSAKGFATTEAEMGIATTSVSWCSEASENAIMLQYTKFLNVRMLTSAKFTNCCKN